MQQATTDDERFMREALAEAQLAAAEGEVPIGAVVAYEGHIIARAHNRRETDEDPSAHAEFSAMVTAAQALGRWRLTGCTVYVTLEPCLMCAGLMVNARIDRCVYGATDPKGGAVGTLFDVSADERLNHSFEVTAGVLEDECAEMLRAFFAELRGRSGEDKTAEMDEGEALCSCHHPKAVAKLAVDAPRFLLVVDSFKGSATSTQAEAWLQEGILRAKPSARVTCLPIADGGEGTLAALQTACDGDLRTAPAHDPFGARITAPYLPMGPGANGRATCQTDPAPLAGLIAVIEMAQVAGLGFSPATHEAALAASTSGVGELMLDAIAQGARTIYIGLGGSATSDGGAGMLQALGAQLLDAAGNPIAPGLQGLHDLVSIDLAPARKALQGATLIALSDVNNPLVGKRGAIRIFGPQKGIANDSALSEAEHETTLATCDSWMTTYAAHLTAARDALDDTPLQVSAPGKRARSLAGVPGAGAAGGLGAALLALGAELRPGIDTVLELLNFDEAARQADLVITGEGALDNQTAGGKAPVGVARRAKTVSPRTPVAAVCGSRANDLDAVYQQGIDLVLPVLRKPMSLEQALTPEETRRNLICAGETAARTLDLPRAR